MKAIYKIFLVLLVVILAKASLVEDVSNTASSILDALQSLSQAEGVANFNGANDGCKRYIPDDNVYAEKGCLVCLEGYYRGYRYYD